MPPRVRVQDLRQDLSGSYFDRIASPQTSFSTRKHGIRRQTSDVVGNFPNPNGFESITRITYLPVLNGVFYSPPGNKRNGFENYPMDHNFEPTTPASVFPDPSDAQKSNMAWETLARTNLATPDVGLPTFISELKDIPSLVQSWGKGLLRRSATAHLTAKWAIAPMMRDLAALSRFNELVSNRLKFLNRLAEGEKVIRRRYTIDRQAKHSAPSLQILQSKGTSFTAYRTAHHTLERWCTVQYTASATHGIPFNLDDRLLKAKELVLGANTWGAMSALWEIYPWSWLADWYFQIGTVLQAMNNTLPLTSGNMCLMQTTKSKFVYEYKTRSTWAVASGAPMEEYILKKRWLVAPLLPPLPIVEQVLSPAHWSILGSLAVVKSSLR